MTLVDFDMLAAECAPWVAPQTLAAIVRTESQFKPLAININGGARLERQPANKEEAVATAKWLIANRYNIDVGLGQVNSANLSKTNLSVENAFDPCKNLAASATILKWNYDAASKKLPENQAALGAAISAYNTGSFTRGYSNGYVQKVVNNARVASTGEDTQKATASPIPIIKTNKKLLTNKVTTASQNSGEKKIETQQAELINEVSLSVYQEEPSEKVMVYQ